MKTLGLTGSIATGKSTVLDMFASLGCAIFSADEQVHDLYEAEAVPLVGSFYPPAIINGRVDRQSLARFLVSDPSLLHELEELIHPLVHSRYLVFLEQAARQQAKLAVADIPLLFEGKNDYNFDAIAITSCSAQKQMQRALLRPGMNEEKLNVILARQLDPRHGIKLADFIIETDGSLSRTRRQVENIVGKLQ